MAGQITAVRPGSPSANAGLQPGDFLVALNGHPLTDIIDYQYYSATSHVHLTWQDQQGICHQAPLFKRPQADLGLTFGENLFDGMRECCNHCLFCFVNQLPTGCRASLYLKDDDYRMSFMLGNYITGTNLSQADVARIKELRLSPLYFSVHATEDDLRRKLLGNVHAQPILPFLRELLAAGIELHCQIVLCPGLNDGPHLAQSMADLLELSPGVASVALVPVGLTRHHNPALRPYTKEEAAAVLALCRQYQQQALAKTGSHFFFAADEFFLLAEEEIPPDEDYEDYCQLENGIGLVRTLWEEWACQRQQLPPALLEPCSIGLITGVSGAAALTPLVAELNQITNLTVALLPIPNTYFGETVTVTGLVTGSAICQAIEPWRQQQTKKPLLLLSDVMLRYGEDVFLDDTTPALLRQQLDCELVVTANSAAGLVAGMLELIERGKKI